MDGKTYDLEDRTLEFSKRILRMSKSLPKDDTNNIMKNQCVRSGTSVGANYREANDALGNKDLYQESIELTKILSKIISNTQAYNKQEKEG